MTATKVSDALVNQPVPDTDYDVDSTESYQRLRKLWASLPRVPKLVDAPSAPQIFSGAGQSIQLLLKGEESAGALMVAYVSMVPGAQGADDHHQPHEDELWFALQGEWEWTVGDLKKRVGPGAFAYAPRNTKHAFANVGATTAIMITINTPAGHERGFKGASKLLSEGASMDDLEAHFANHDFIFHSPLPRA